MSNAKFPLLEQMRQDREERERSSISFYKKANSELYFEIQQLKKAIDKLSQFLKNPLKDAILEQSGYELRNKLRETILNQCSEIMKNDTPDVIENRILLDLKHKSLPNMQVTVSNAENGLLAVLKVDIPVLRYNFAVNNI